MQRSKGKQNKKPRTNQKTKTHKENQQVDPAEIGGRKTERTPGVNTSIPNDWMELKLGAVFKDLTFIFIFDFDSQMS